MTCAEVAATMRKSLPSEATHAEIGAVVRHVENCPKCWEMIVRWNQAHPGEAPEKELAAFDRALNDPEA